MSWRINRRLGHQGFREDYLRKFFDFLKISWVMTARSFHDVRVILKLHLLRYSIEGHIFPKSDLKLLFYIIILFINTYIYLILKFQTLSLISPKSNITLLMMSRFEIRTHQYERISCVQLEMSFSRCKFHQLRIVITYSKKSVLLYLLIRRKCFYYEKRVRVTSNSISFILSKRVLSCQFFTEKLYVFFYTFFH